MRSRFKRLLETDRARGRNKRSDDPEKANFAFHSADMPGRGHENRFSRFEAFALLLGLRLMGLGLPQGAVVALLRRVRPQLEQQHSQIMRRAPQIFSSSSRFGAKPNRATWPLARPTPYLSRLFRKATAWDHGQSHFAAASKTCSRCFTATAPAMRSHCLN